MSDFKNNQDERIVIPIRPHHGMCLAFFRGEGYSTEFSKHMGRMLSVFIQNADVCLQCITDEICKACPNNSNGFCITEERVRGFDQRVLEYCGLQPGQVLEFNRFTELVQERILTPGLRNSICGTCQWNRICAEEKSRWIKPESD